MMIINGVKKKKAPNDTNWVFESLPQNKVMAKPFCSLKDKFPAVYCQTAGDCTANAVLACDAYYYHSPTTPWIPSTIFTYYNSRKMDHAGFKEDDGSTVETALNCVRKFGACNSKIWPNDKPFNEKPSEEAYKNGLKGHEVTNYYRVKSLNQVKKALVSGYPVACAVAWCFKKYDENFVMNKPTKKEVNDCMLGHAIVIVGYDDRTGLIEFRNSWGTGWANNGYAYMTYETFERVIWYSDTYAVVH